jgi:transposase
VHDDPAGLSQNHVVSVSCSVCGTTVDEPPVTWSMQVSERGQTWLCESCARDNIRSIEGKLDEAWW